MKTLQRMSKKQRVAASTVIGASTLGLSFAVLAHEPESNGLDHYANEQGYVINLQQEPTQQATEQPTPTQQAPAKRSVLATVEGSKTSKTSGGYVIDTDGSFDTPVTPAVERTTSNTDVVNPGYIVQPADGSAQAQTQAAANADSLVGAQGSRYPTRPASPDITIVDEPLPAIGGPAVITASAAVNRVQTTTVAPTRRVVERVQIKAPVERRTVVQRAEQAIGDTSKEARVTITSNNSASNSSANTASSTGTIVSEATHIKYPDGSQYQGVVTVDQPHGQGKRTWSDGSVYTGEFKHGVFHGKGRFAAPTGYEYDGAWHEGQMHGKGSVKWPGGIRYTGMFDVNRKHGPGEFIFPNGSRLAVIFKHDIAEKQATLIEANGKQTPVDININH